MKLNLFTLLCLIGIPFALSIPNWPSSQITPLLIKQQVTWPVAQNYCRENHLDLFTIKTPNDQAQLIREMNNHNETGPVWTGLYNDLDHWYWSYDHLPLKNISLTRWAPGQPDNGNGEDVCGVIDNTGYWWAYSCSASVSYICYDANNSPSNKFVGYGSPTLTWPDAQTFCRQQHTDLATSVTQSDITLLQQVLAKIMWNGGWFGLTRDTWKWSDGTKPLNLPWLSGQPDNFYTWENCGTAQNGQLLDEKCTDEHYFVCSAYLFKSQIMKLQVKSDASVFDPVVQSFILELINQKLQENGMLENTTASWRVQANGNIFYKKIGNK